MLHLLFVERALGFPKAHFSVSICNSNMLFFFKSNVHTSHGLLRALPSSELLDGTEREHNFLETTFFETNQHLPAPAQVKALRQMR